MDRRCFLFGITAGLSPLLVHAGASWRGVDMGTPLYLAGTVLRADWQAPRVRVLIQPEKPLRLPADLQQRALPAQRAHLEGAALLARTRLPVQVLDEWTLDLAPRHRVHAWGIPALAPGERVEAIGYALRDAGAEAAGLLRVEYLFHAGRAYGLRSAPR